MKKSCLIAVIAALAAVAGAFGRCNGRLSAPPSRSWTNTSACCLARTTLPRQSRFRQRIPLLRMPPRSKSTSPSGRAGCGAARPFC